MIVKFKRCKHCGKEYKYYASGMNTVYNNDTYCNECYKAMMESLNKIPIKYTHGYNTLPNRLIDIITYEKLEKLKKEFIDEQRNAKFPITLKCFPKCYSYETENSQHFKYCEEYIYNGMDIIVCFDDLKDKHKIIKVKSEYDIENKIFTGKIWYANETENKYIPLSLSPILSELKEANIKPNLSNVMKLEHEDCCSYLTEVLENIYNKKGS